MKTTVMRLTKSLSILLLSLCFYACGNKPYPHTMQIADTLVYSNPDSAYKLLEQIKDSITAQPQSTQMYYHLLSIKAKDKAYITHTSDSLIQYILHYYENKNDEKHLPETYYYAGRVYSDLGDAPQALDYYQKAAELLEGSTNYQLLKVVYSQMGELFLYQDVYEEAMEAFRKAFRYDTLKKDNRGMIIDLCNIGATFTAFNNADSALHYYQKAYAQAKRIENKKLMDRVQSYLMSLYIQLEQYDLAKTTLKSLDYHQLQNQIATCTIAANLFYQTGEKDSAKYYYRKLLYFGNIYAQQAAHWGLAKIAQKESNCRSALDHIKQYNDWTDSIKKIIDSENIRKAQSYYNYQLREKENAQLQKANAQQKQWVIYSIITIILLTTFYIIHTLYAKEKKNKLKAQLNKLKQIEEEQYRKSNLFIEENKQKIKELEKEIQIRNKNNDAMRQLLLAQKEQILRMNSKIEADQKEQSLAEIAFHQSEIYGKFRDAANGNGTIETKDWEILRIKVDHCYKDFTKRLRAIYPVSEIEMKICLLIKIKINVTGISLITGRSKSAIVSARKKLYEKTHGESCKPEQWDAFVLSL